MTRWTRRLLVGAIAILVPALAGCEAGLNAPTLEFHPAAAGNSTTFNGITVENAFVLGPASGSSPLPSGGQAGVFMSLYTQGSDRLVSASAGGVASSVQLVNGPVTLTANRVEDLSGPSPQLVLNGLTSPLSGGETVPLTLNFANAGSVTIDVPVEPASYDFATYSPPPSPTASASASPGAKHKHKHKKAKANASSSATPSPSVSVSPSATS